MRERHLRSVNSVSSDCDSPMRYLPQLPGLFARLSSVAPPLAPVYGLDLGCGTVLRAIDARPSSETHVPNLEDALPGAVISGLLKGFYQVALLPPSVKHLD